MAVVGEITCEICCVLFGNKPGTKIQLQKGHIGQHDLRQSGEVARKLK